MRWHSDGPHTGVAFPLDSQPEIVAKHIDGPLLIFSDGQLHWLTLWERLQFTFGLTDAERLQRKRRPTFDQKLVAARAASLHRGAQ